MAKKEKDNDFDLNFGEDTSAEAEKEEAGSVSLPMLISLGRDCAGSGVEM